MWSNPSIAPLLMDSIEHWRQCGMSNVRPLVAGTRGTCLPSCIPNRTPYAPGNRPKRLSKLLFSLMRKTTCLIGVVVWNESALTAAGSGALTRGPGQSISGGFVDVTVASSWTVHATPSKANATTASPSRTAAREREGFIRGEATNGWVLYERGSPLRGGGGLESLTDTPIGSSSRPRSFQTARVARTMGQL